MTSGRTTPTFGVLAPGFAWGVTEAVALRAEELGFDAVWLTDHMLNPMKLGGQTTWDNLDSWTAAAVLAGRTQRVRFGFMMLNPGFRPAALLAKMTATFDAASGGRLIFSVGAGYFEEEYRQYDLDWDADAADRLARARETAMLCRELWTHPREGVSFDGVHVRAHDCYLGVDVAQQPHPPIWYGGDSPDSRKLMDEITGDGPLGGWFMHMHCLDDNLAWFRAESRHAGQAGFTLATYAFCRIGATRDEAITAARAFVPVHPRYERDFDDTIRFNLFGTLAEVRDRIGALLDRGIGHLVFVADPVTLETLATEVLPACRRNR